MTRCRRSGTARGSTSLLVVGFAIVAIMMVAVVVDASAAYLRRSALDSLADGAALAAADGIRAEQVYAGGLTDRARLDPATARRYVAEHLVATGAASRYPGLRYDVEATPERVVVHVAAPLQLPITPPGWERRPLITATAASYVVVSD